MELKGERLIPVPVESTWAALNNPDVLRDCITGCELLEHHGDDSYQALVTMRMGPVSARFKGKLLLCNVKAPYSYTLHFDGQGGAAGFGKGSADVALVAEGGHTRLSYVAQAQVGGKLAQLGSRLIDASAGKIAEDFFDAFEATLKAAVPEVAAMVAAPAPAAVGYPKWVVWAVAGATLLAAAAAYWMVSAG